MNVFKRTRIRDSPKEQPTESRGDSEIRNEPAALGQRYSQVFRMSHLAKKKIFDKFRSSYFSFHAKHSQDGHAKLPVEGTYLKF